MEDYLFELVLSDNKRVIVTSDLPNSHLIHSPPYTKTYELIQHAKHMAQNPTQRSTFIHYQYPNEKMGDLLIKNLVVNVSALLESTEEMLWIRLVYYMAISLSVITSTPFFTNIPYSASESVSNMEHIPVSLDELRETLGGWYYDWQKLSLDHTSPWCVEFIRVLEPPQHMRACKLAMQIAKELSRIG